MAKRSAATAALATGAVLSTGVGESRPFIAPEGAFEADPHATRDWDTATLNGMPVPEALRGIIPWEMTDQGHREKHDGVEHARVTVVVDEVSQSINRRGGDLDRGMDPLEAFDPMQELVREHVPPGMRPKFLSQRKVHAEGTTRGYTICRDANGDPVKLGTNILGYMPEERAARIQQAFEDKSLELQRGIHGEDFDPRRPMGERITRRVAKQEGDLSSSLTGGSIRSFENPGGGDASDPGDSDFGLHGDGAGEDFQP